MPVTKKDRTRRGRRRDAVDGHAERSAHRRQPQTAGDAVPRDAKRAAEAVPHPRRVKAGEAAARIRGLADLSDSLDGRRRLRRLARIVAEGSRQARRIAFIEGLLGECLDDATAAAGTRERWRTAEAVTWALAWLARTRRAGGSAGGLLERLVKIALAACADLRARDTSSAAFVTALARLFVDIEACRCLEREASAALSEELARLVSSDGAVMLASDASGSAAVVERVERWSAVREIARATAGSSPWDARADERWRSAAVATLRLLGARGQMLAGGGGSPLRHSRRLLDAAVDGTGRAARTAAVVRNPPRDVTPREAKRLLPRDLHAADSALAILRTGWHRDAIRVLVDYRGLVPRLEIATADRLIVDGPWSYRVWLDGRPLEAEGPWTVGGFESDRKATFLEIAAPLGGGLQLTRQVVVLVRDAVVLLADAITSPTPPAGATLRLESAIALGQALEAEAAAETREVVAYDTALRLMALPLALPEWTAAPTAGGFESAAGSLVLRQETAGGRLYAPLWLDCDPTRIGRPLTWRQLTVADTRHTLPRHQAVGFRVQSGREQWLLYQSLDMPRNRSVLGCNLSCDFLLGGIRKDGVVSRTLEIEEARR